MKMRMCIRFSKNRLESNQLCTLSCVTQRPTLIRIMEDTGHEVLKSLLKPMFELEYVLLVNGVGGANVTKITVVCND